MRSFGVQCSSTAPFAAAYRQGLAALRDLRHRPRVHSARPGRTSDAAQATRVETLRRMVFLGHIGYIVAFGHRPPPEDSPSPGRRPGRKGTFDEKATALSAERRRRGL